MPPIWPLLQTTSFDPPNFFSKLGPWYLGMVFTSDGRWNKDIDTRIGNANTVMRELYRSVSQNVSFPVFVPIFTYGPESWARTERVLSEVQAEKKGFLRRVQGVTLSGVRRKFSWGGHYVSAF